MMRSATLSSQNHHLRGVLVAIACLLDKMRCFAVLVCLINVVAAFKVQRASWIRSASLAVNKLDGVVISGNLTPLSNNLLIKVKEAMTSTAGGLYIPDNAKERPTEGLVVAAGPGRVHPETGYQLDCAVSSGDSVIYGKYDGTEMKYNDENHQLIKDDDVLLKYKGNDLTLENCEPVKDQVMIKLQSRETTNAAGIIVNAVDNKETRIDCGIVAKVGPGRQAGNGVTMPLQLTPGDGVRFRDFAGSDIKIQGVEYRVIRAYDILARWTE